VSTKRSLWCTHCEEKKKRGASGEGPGNVMWKSKAGGQSVRGCGSGERGEREGKREPNFTLAER